MLGMPVLILVALAWHFQPPPEDAGVEFNKH
jgi:hypothetical protein